MEAVFDHWPLFLSAALREVTAKKQMALLSPACLWSAQKHLNACLIWYWVMFLAVRALLLDFALSGGNQMEHSSGDMWCFVL